MIVIMTVIGIGNAKDATMIVVMTVLGSFGNAEDAVMILVMTVVILIIIVRMIIMIFDPVALVMQRMLRW